MNFNSVEFMLFLPTLLILYWAVFRRDRLRDYLLLSASYFFYGSWNVMYAGLMLLSTVVDYGLGRLMDREERPKHRKFLLVLSLVLNLGLLATFKYFNFFVDLTGDGLRLMGFDPNVSSLHLRLLLPVGISFYTFQSLSYTIDVYRREIRAERSLAKFALFVSFFPQLVAGPIVRAADFLPQLQRRPTVDQERVRKGMLLILRGLAKKMLLADLLAGLGVDAVFSNPGAYSSVTLLFALYGYAFQIYNDFSGYSDIAIGSAHLLGYDLTKNFDRPYLSRNIREFWTRWHISLSTWLRDYLYIPLGGNRGTAGRIRFNLMVTMLLGGLWHGAALNFVFWGLWHGILLTIGRARPKVESDSSPVTVWRQRLVTFHLVVFGWLLFRVDSWAQLSSYVAGLARLSLGTELRPLYFAVLSIAALTHFTSKERLDSMLARFTVIPVPLQAAVYAVVIVLLSALALGTPAFIYFQF